MQRFSRNDVEHAFCKAYGGLKVMPENGIFVQGTTPHAKKSVMVEAVTKNLDYKEVKLDDGTALKVLGDVSIDGHLVEPKVTTGEKITTVEFSTFDAEEGNDISHKYLYVEKNFFDDFAKVINDRTDLDWTDCVRFALEQATQLKIMPEELVVYNGHYKINSWLNTKVAVTKRMVKKESARLTDTTRSIFLDDIPISATIVIPKAEGEEPIQMCGYSIIDTVKTTEAISKFLLVKEGFCEEVAKELQAIMKEKEEKRKQNAFNVEENTEESVETSIFERIKQAFDHFLNWFKSEG